MSSLITKFIKISNSKLYNYPNMDRPLTPIRGQFRAVQNILIDKKRQKIVWKIKLTSLVLLNFYFLIVSLKHLLTNHRDNNRKKIKIKIENNWNKKLFTISSKQRRAPPSKIESPLTSNNVTYLPVLPVGNVILTYTPQSTELKRYRVVGVLLYVTVTPSASGSLDRHSVAKSSATSHPENLFVLSVAVAIIVCGRPDCASSKRCNSVLLIGDVAALWQSMVSCMSYRDSGKGRGSGFQLLSTFVS